MQKLTNSNTLLVVFVSSEGSVLPIIVKSLSGKQVNQTLDITDNEAVHFLSSDSLSEELSRRLVDYVGGRFIYMMNCI